MRTHHKNMILAFLAVGGLTMYLTKNKVGVSVAIGSIAAFMASKHKVNMKRIGDV